MQGAAFLVVWVGVKAVFSRLRHGFARRFVCRIPWAEQVRKRPGNESPRKNFFGDYVNLGRFRPPWPGWGFHSTLPLPIASQSAARAAQLVQIHRRLGFCCISSKFAATSPSATAAETMTHSLPPKSHHAQREPRHTGGAALVLPMSAIAISGQMLIGGSLMGGSPSIF